MNCQCFNSLMHEYLDETLDTRDQAAALEHVQHCPACQRALEDQRHLSKAMRQCLETATAGLALRPDLRRNVLQALESKPQRSPGWLAAWRCLVFGHAGFRFRFGLRHWAVSLLCGSLLALFLYQRLTKDSAPQAVAQSVSPIIDVPLPAQTYVFRRQNGTVTDTLSMTVAEAHADFSGSRETLTKQ